jgi:alkylhydroperoxidase family enzyme
MVTHPREIQWSDPVLPALIEPEVEARIKRQFGMVPDLVRRIASCPWLLRTSLYWAQYRYTHLTHRQQDIGSLVASQENACRYCYGSARAAMRLLGYGERLITRIERDSQLAELDEKERAFIRFCRNLARSKPRPGRAMREELLALGFTPLAVAEMAFLIVNTCHSNRLCTLLACKPEAAVEAMAEKWFVWVLRPLIRYMMRKGPRQVALPAQPEGGPLSAVADTLRGLPARDVVQISLTEAFRSEVIAPSTKALMFAVIARTLDCPYCEMEMLGMLERQGFPRTELEASLASFSATREDPQAEALLSFARNTVHYQPQEIQRHTRELLALVGPEKTLEAVGVAALANATVRLAVLLT